MYRLDDYDYHLPPELIAQEPAGRRDKCRLLTLERSTGRVTHGVFGDLIRLLEPGDVLVINDTRVIAGRLYGRKETGGKVEVLILDYHRGRSSGIFRCLVRASKRPRTGSRLYFDLGLEAAVMAAEGDTLRLRFSGVQDLDGTLEQIGSMPLPPYIRRQGRRQDRRDYQTVYARSKGAIAAPTAGLHFTTAMLEKLRQRQVEIVPLTLHVGYGTFVPVRVEDIRNHRMHSEWYELSRESAERIAAGRRAGGRVVAVGTTCVRTLEYCAGADGSLEPGQGACDLFIYPGYTFRIVDAMITNFHLPKSTLLMLVSAFAGRPAILSAYREAVEAGYRFFSYGDAMFIH